MNRELNDEPTRFMIEEPGIYEMKYGNVKSDKYDAQTSSYVDWVAPSKEDVLHSRCSPYAGVSDDGREFVLGRINPLVGKLTYDMENIREEMEVMQMIMRGFAARRKEN